MQQMGKITYIRGNICTVEFTTSLGCCGGKKADDGSACCGKENARLLSFRAHRGQHAEAKIGDQVLVESNSFMVWCQAFMAILFPAAFALVLFYGLDVSWQGAFLSFPAAWLFLGISRWLFPQSTMPVISIVNPPVLAFEDFNEEEKEQEWDIGML